MAGAGAKKAAAKRGRALRGRRGAEAASPEVEAEDAVVEMVEVLSCPMEVGSDHIRRLANAMSDVDLGHDLARLAARLHPDAPLVPVLVEIAATYQRHFREYDVLLDRLVGLVDHGAEHAHVTLDDEALRAMMATMFRTSREGSVE